jgi:TRAP-type uncharacterized transport system fused permease subunit
MVERWTASSAVFYTIIVMFLVMFATQLTPSKMGRGEMSVLYIIPIVISAAFRLLGETAQLSLFWGLGVATVIVIGLGFVKNRIDGGAFNNFKNTIFEIYSGLIAGARNMVGIAVAVATAGIIVGAVSSTGLNNAMVGVIEALSGGNVYILLILTAFLSLILGMGLPTTANYIVVASLLAGVLVELGTAAGLELPLIAVHLFVFYFGLMADSTPPVCLAAFAASAISRADPLKTGIQSFLYDIRTAILPFVFIFNPELLLIGITSIWHGLTVFTVSLIAILCFSSATQGWLLIKANVTERIILLIVTFALFRPDFFLNQIYPEYLEIDFNRFVENKITTKINQKIRLHSVRETDYGERFKLYVFKAPGEKSGQDTFGLKLTKDKKGRHSIADLAPKSIAEKVKMDFGDFVTSVEVEQFGRPAKETVYPFALIILGIILFMQRQKRKNAKRFNNK